MERAAEGVVGRLCSPSPPPRPPSESRPPASLGLCDFLILQLDTRSVVYIGISHTTARSIHPSGSPLLPYPDRTPTPEPF